MLLSIIIISMLFLLSRFIGRERILNHIILVIISMSLSDILLGNIFYGYSWINDIYNSTVKLVSNSDINLYTIVVEIVGFSVILTSNNYMSVDAHKTRFIIYLTSFALSMILFIRLGHNHLNLFIMWEILGLFSYLLIGFWYNSYLNVLSSNMALFVNKIGDYLLLSGIAGIIYITTDIYIEIKYIIILTLFGTLSKSAFIGFHPWLKNAMAGPTPVSSLLHSATIVTAGIYLLIRLNSSNTIEITIIMLIIGSITTIYSGSLGTSLKDIKRVIAFSTCSQLSIMGLSSIYSSTEQIIGHLVNHACYKSLLFLIAGQLIHSMYNIQDIRLISSSKTYNNNLVSIYILASLCLTGSLFLAGYYSKDLIYDINFMNYSFSSIFSYFSIFIASIFTSLYSSLLLYNMFLKYTRLFIKTDMGIEITTGMNLLGIMSCIIGPWFQTIPYGLLLDINLNKYSVIIPFMSGLIGSIWSILNFINKRLSVIIITNYLYDNIVNSISKSIFSLGYKLGYIDKIIFELPRTVNIRNILNVSRDVNNPIVLVSYLVFTVIIVQILIGLF